MSGELHQGGVRMYNGGGVYRTIRLYETILRIDANNITNVH
jgi:hypothetical protein